MSGIIVVTKKQRSNTKSMKFSKNKAIGIGIAIVIVSVAVYFVINSSQTNGGVPFLPLQKTIS